MQSILLLIANRTITKNRNCLYCFNHDCHLVYFIIIIFFYYSFCFSSTNFYLFGLDFCYMCLFFIFIIVLQLSVCLVSLFVLVFVCICYCCWFFWFAYFQLRQLKFKNGLLSCLICFNSGWFCCSAVFVACVQMCANIYFIYFI